MGEREIKNITDVNKIIFTERYPLKKYTHKKSNIDRNIIYIKNFLSWLLFLINSAIKIVKNTFIIPAILRT